MVVRMRHNRTQRGTTRSHHFLKNVTASKCPDCGSPVLRHRACSNCGKYKSKTALVIKSKVSKKSDKKAEAK